MIHFCKFIAGLLFLACLISFLWRKFDDRLFFTWALAKAKFAKARPSSIFLFFKFLPFLLHFILAFLALVCYH